MIKTKKELKEWLTVEEKIYNPGIKKMIPILFDEFQILWLIVKRLRKAEYYSNKNHKSLFAIIARFNLKRIQNRYGVHLPLNVFGKGLSIAHLGPIVINQDTKIGDNCRIHVGVNIGANGGGSPVIGDDVYIGPGAKIFGEITIADGIKIGANAVVNKSCNHQNAILVGVPAHEVIGNAIKGDTNG